MKVVQYGAGHAEGAPHPVRFSAVALDLDLANPAVAIGHDGVEQFGARHRECQKRQLVFGQAQECVLRQPDRVGQPDQHRLAGIDERHGAEDCVAQPLRLRLHGIDDRGMADLAAVILQDVELPARDHKADLVGAALQHPLDQVFADRARPLGAVILAAADRQQFLREGQWLDAGAIASGGNDAPHGSSLHRRCRLAGRGPGRV